MIIPSYACSYPVSAADSLVILLFIPVVRVYLPVASLCTFTCVSLTLKKSTDVFECHTPTIAVLPSSATTFFRLCTLVNLSLYCSVKYM